MNPVEFAGSNETIKGNGKNVADLKCFVDETRIVSCWELDEFELVRLMRSRRIFLSVLGKQMVPVRLDVVSVEQDDPPVKGDKDIREALVAARVQNTFLEGVLKELAEDQHRGVEGLRDLAQSALDVMEKRKG